MDNHGLDHSEPMLHNCIYILQRVNFKEIPQKKDFFGLQLKQNQFWVQNSTLQRSEFLPYLCSKLKLNPILCSYLCSIRCHYHSGDGEEYPVSDAELNPRWIFFHLRIGYRDTDSLISWR
ncbi:hypothetical protein CDAR_580681 [Caerostris darwini]|uniref:Ycf2 n=1 Tax=Caerostris darwini TaxID=1538125 RepID=A0AAV4TVH2_9ARAC|nr:hypothetical protein CDAR_580681 [Caerostris darwini]